MHRSAITLLLLLAFLTISPFAVLASTTIVVNTINDEDVTNSTCSLREAITTANNNANYGGCVKSGTGAYVITFSSAVFSTSQTITLSSDFPTITRNLSITGPGSNLLTISSGDVFRPFVISAPATAVTISGMTLLDVGSPAGAGGAINVSSGTVTLNNMAFTSNVASLTGGAIHVASGATVKVNNSSFQNNSSTIGGAIYSDGTLRVSNSSFTNNFAFDYGGAITNTGANSVIGGSTFYSNDSNGTGGAYIGNGTIFNSTFLDNTASAFGGAIANINTGTLKLIHVTVANNDALASEGDGLYVQDDSPTATATINIMNSILADNDENDCWLAGDGVVNANFSLISDGSCGITNGVNGNLVAPAFFSPNALQTNGGPTMTLALSPASPGVNAGSNSYRMEGNAAVNTDFNGDNDKTDTLSTDQRGTGFPRTNHTTVDMGAFETSTVFTGLTVDTNSDAALYSCTNAADDCSLRGAIMLANGRTGTDTISFASSVFSSPQTITLGTGLPAITTNITINGPGLNTTVSGDSQYQHFFINNAGILTINGLTISNGFDGGNGGAFYVGDGTLNLSNSSVTNNFSSGDGGAIYLAGGNLNISNSSFSNNISSASGGAIHVFSSDFSNTTVRIRVTDSSFSNNSSINSGGAIYTGSPIYISGSTFSGNNSGEGAGIRINGGAVFNSTFANNIAGSQGGAINNDTEQSLSLINVTLSNNSANGGMGGASVYTGNAALFIMNSILADSTAGGECTTNLGLVSVFNSLVEDASCGVVAGSSGNLVSDAFLDTNGLQNNGGLSLTIELAPSSPAVNAGNNNYLVEANVGIDFNNDGDFLDTLSTDQRGTGFTRVLNTTVDMGAFESPGGWTGFVVDTVSDDNLFYCTSAPNDCSLRGAINLANARSGADAISFETTVFSTAKVISLNSSLPALSGIVNINGPGENLLTIDGNFSYRPFYIANSAIVSISALKVTHAASGLEDGAAIYIDNGSLNLTNITFSNNEAATGNGGVIYANLGSLNITDSYFNQNLSNGNGGVIATNDTHLDIDNSIFDQNSSNNNGGAIAITTGGTIIIRNSSFANNSAVSNGGAIYTLEAIQVLDSLFEDNTASNNGGAIFSQSIHPDYTTIAGSSFGGNQADNGGALVGNVRVVNSSFFENTATSSGGAIYSADQSVYLFYVSMGFNSAASGGAVYSDSGYIELVNSIIADSTNGGDCAKGGSATLFAIATILEDDSCDFNEATNGNLVADPMFDIRGLQDNGGPVPSLTISPLSPAIDAGDPGSSNVFLLESSFAVDVNGDGDTNDTIDYDQRGTGFPRVDGQVDMGAIEQASDIVLEVDTTSDTNVFICTSAAGDCSLRGAITLANLVIGADTIAFDATVFATQQTISLTSALPNITDSLTITGTGLNLLRINGQDTHRPFYIDNGAYVTISNLHIRDGFSTGDGGAIHLATGNLTFDSVSVTSSSSQDDGGALFIATGTNATISNSNFGSNTATHNGGAIYNSGNLRVDNTSFQFNHAPDDGGAIYNENVGTAIEVGGSNFQDNTGVSDAGAIYGSAIVFNSTFSGNTTDGFGGAFFLQNAAHSLTLLNVTINNNSASLEGGGIYVMDATLTLRNTIVSNNTGGDCDFDTATLSILSSLIEDGGCGITDGVDGNLIRDPLLLNNSNNNGGLTYTFALPPASPAKNAGSNGYLAETIMNIDFNNDNDFDDSLETDQRGTGFNRSNNETVDMGAYETTGSFTGLVVDTTGDESIKNFCTAAANDCSLHGAVFLANGMAGADTITFDGTVFGSAQTMTIESDIDVISGDLNIIGPGINLLTIEKDGISQIFSIDNFSSPPTVSISGMILIGDDSNPGSLIYLGSGTLSINNMNFNNNVSYSGGAIYAQYGSTLSVSNSSFTENYATSGDGGAINGATASSVTITNSVFSNNESSNNGGAVFSDSFVHILNSSFSNNSSSGHGGAVYANINSNITIGNSSFRGNTGGNGGAFGGRGGKVFNSSFYANTSTGECGGAICSTTSLSLLNVTISANSAANGGGLGVDGGSAFVWNSIIANNTGEDCLEDGAFTVNNSLIEDGTCNVLSAGTGNLTGDPYVAPFANYGGTVSVLGLLPFSPAINAGNNAYLSEAAVNIDFNNDGDTLDTLDTDQRGPSFTRILNTTVDMGAFEANPSTSVSNIAPIRNYYTTNTPTLTWGRVSWATGYEVQISTTTSFSTLQCSGTASIAASNLSYTTCALPAGTYYWRARAISSTGAGAWSAVDVFVIGGP